VNNNIRAPEKKKGFRKLPIFFLLSLSIILLGTTGYFFYQYQRLSQSQIAAQVTAQEEAQKLAEDLGKLMLLPKDETPTVATVTDIEKLKDQLFFKNATNGNKVLIYPNSKLAVIYDPKANLIVNVGPINFSGPPTEAAEKTRIGLRNGTDIVGLTQKIEAEIKKSFPDADIVQKDQDKRTDYEKTIVVALNDASKDKAAELAKTLNSQVELLPEGETNPPEIDILIIVGKDKS
jgi:hypothetical protein